MDNWELTFGVEFDDRLFVMQTEERRNAYLKIAIDGDIVSVSLVSGGSISFHLDDWPLFFHLAEAVNRTIEFIENGS